MAEAVQPPTVRRAQPSADPGGWVLMLVPTGICLVMFVVAALW